MARRTTAHRKEKQQHIGRRNNSTRKGGRDRSEMTDKKEKGDSEESPIEKEHIDELVNEWCFLYREISQAMRDNHEESR